LDRCRCSPISATSNRGTYHITLVFFAVLLPNSVPLLSKPYEVSPSLHILIPYLNEPWVFGVDWLGSYHLRYQLQYQYQYQYQYEQHTLEGECEPDE